MDKIKINLAPSDYDAIAYDAETFAFYKSDGDINLNLLLNNIINQMYSIRRSVRENFRNQLHADLDEYHVPNSILDDLLTIMGNNALSLVNYISPENLSASVSLRLSKANEGIYEEITSEELKGMSLSAYLRIVILQYLHMPQAERERILFFDDWMLIRQCLDEERYLRIFRNDGTSFLFKPYALQENQESSFIYVYGIEEGRSTPSSFHLFKIANAIHRSNSFYHFSKQESALLDKNLSSNGIPFAGGTPMDAKVETDSYGAKMLKAIYYNRPLIVGESVSDQEHHVFTLRGSFENIAQYVYRLGSHAYILEPEGLLSYVFKLHRQAFDTYCRRAQKEKKLK
jgi:hypothetical protein